MSVKVIHEPRRPGKTIYNWRPPKQPKHHSETQGVYEKVRKQTGVGKGDNPRPLDLPTFRKNFDAINWKKKDERVGNKQRPSKRADH